LKKLLVTEFGKKIPRNEDFSVNDNIQVDKSVMICEICFFISDFLI